jgi:hypothetical protein
MKGFAMAVRMLAVGKVFVAKNGDVGATQEAKPSFASAMHFVTLIIVLPCLLATLGTCLPEKALLLIVSAQCNSCDNCQRFQRQITCCKQIED